MKTKTLNIFQKIWPLIFLFFSVGCGTRFETYQSLYIAGDKVKGIDGANDDGSGGNLEDPIDPNLKFCSPLDFEHVTWSKTMSLQARRSFAVALSITGRFEGRSGWANLSNNFDGQGLSAGLLNQTLGTGSLQPLLWTMLTTSRTDFTTSFSKENGSSITSMLQTWNSTQSSITSQSFIDENEEDWRPTEKRAPSIKATSANSPSVQWAISNLYQSDSRFKIDWKQQLQTLLQKPTYVSIQISAAEKIHNKALIYVKRVGFNDLRTYLLMFDFVTQNGSIKESRFQEWETAVKAEKLISKIAILKKLVEIRLQDTIEEWRDDVRSRKYALIDGIGAVHGENLNLPSSYCYKPTDQIQ